MSLIVDLGASATWLNAAAKWPSWLDTAWLTAQNARLICRLTHPDDLTALRVLVPDPGRLLAYPSYPHLEQYLTQNETKRVHHTFLECLGADTYIELMSGAADSGCPQPQVIIRSDRPERAEEKRLALVAPMPPTASGIANYCGELLPALAQYYRVTLVVEDRGYIDAALSSQYEVMSHTQFLKLGTSFDRVMYHFGNSPFHYDYFTLIKAHPGVAVLHDIYLGDCILSNFKQLGTVELRQQVYASHGWVALQDFEGPIKQAIGLYPACASVFSDSYGVLVHSQFARDNLSLYFDEDILHNLTHTALARRVKDLPEKAVSRRTLDIADATRVYASFGLFNANKCVSELMQAWAASDIAKDSSVKLCLVGGFSDREIEERMRDAISQLPLPEQVVMTGFVDDGTYEAYLSATDIAIQLRRNSRGESSAALLDCMAAGLTTIINAHGSMAELPDNTVIKLKDDFSIDELANALRLTYSAVSTADNIGAVARSYVREHHSPAKISAAYSRHMEACYQSNPKILVNSLHKSLFTSRSRDISASDLWGCMEDINDLISCTGRGGPSLLAGPQLLVDLTAVVQHDPKSGIQRVVRNILREFLQKEYFGYRVEAVYYDFASEKFRYARSFVNQFLCLSPLYLSDDSVEARPGDIYLSLDLCYQVAGRDISRGFLQLWRGRGVKIYHVLYDLLPLVLPHCFPPDQIPIFRNWLTSVSQVSDGVISISRSVANDYRAWLDQENVFGVSRPKVGYFHLGAEMEAGAGGRVKNPSEMRVLSDIQGQSYLLMVGTVEPRKGHQQVLDAFEILWSQGVNLSLVVVGSIGWVEGEVAERLKDLDARSERLHWLNYVSDSMLEALYEQAAGTIMASFGEGFGLPLIEAAFYGSSLLARDLPVFREVCGNHAWYFHARDGEGLALELRAWLELYNSSSLPNPVGIEWQNWKQSATQLLSNVVDDRWYDSENNS